MVSAGIISVILMSLPYSTLSLPLWAAPGSTETGDKDVHLCASLRVSPTPAIENVIVMAFKYMYKNSNIILFK